MVDKEKIKKEFPYKYVGGGYFRDSRVKKGDKADILHGNEVLEKLIDFINEQPVN